MNQSGKQTLFVNALIHNDNQQILMIRRAKGDHFLPGYLELPGGRVELGESLEHALDRKLLLEVNIDAKMAYYYTSLAQVDTHGPYVRIIFEVAYNQKQPIKLSAAHDEYVWVDSLMIPNEKITSDAKSVAKRYLGDRTTSDDNNTTQTFTIYTDGGSRGNPGPSASAYAIYKGDKLLELGGSYIGITTNNQAEYTAVALALKAASQFAGNEDVILFSMDSLLVVNQLNGLYKIKNRDLWPVNQEIRGLIKNFKQVRFHHIPREQNMVADTKVNEILDLHKK